MNNVQDPGVRSELRGLMLLDGLLPLLEGRCLLRGTQANRLSDFFHSVRRNHHHRPHSLKHKVHLNDEYEEKMNFQLRQRSALQRLLSSLALILELHLETLSSLRMF